MDSVVYAETLSITEYTPIDLKDVQIKTLTSRKKQYYLNRNSINLQTITIMKIFRLLSKVLPN